MRRIVVSFVAMALLSAVPVFAAPGDGVKDTPTAATGAADSSAKAPNNAEDSTAKKDLPAKPESVPAAELQGLRDLIQVQQQELASQRKTLEEQQKEIDSLKGQSQAPARSATPELTLQPAPEASTPDVPATSPAPEAIAPDPPVLRAKESSSMNRAMLALPKQTPSDETPKLGPIALQHIKLGVTFFGDYGFYNSTGFGPQFITQINQAGPGNDHFDSFDITRAYLNFFYTPNDKVTLRITPNIYRQVDGSSGSIADGTGANIGGSTNGNLSFRLKYAYIQFNKPFAGSAAFGKDHIVIGSETNPLVDWEEGLYGYRYTSLTPWNYLSLSSTYVGAKIEGPIEFGGREYLDYSLGVYNTASFHSIEQNDKKQVMARLTWYPLGTTSDRTGFLISAFENYGYNTKTPDTKSTPLDRVSVIVSYQTHSKSAQIALEYDFGRNALSTGNLFSGAAPTVGGIYDSGSLLTVPLDIGTVASTVLADDRTRQQGFAFFGHVKLGHSPFALFGLYQYFEPNTSFSPSTIGLTTDPIDFDRTVGGISYAYNKHLDFAVQDSNFHWMHPQGTFGTPDTNGIFLNFQFNY